MNSIKNLICLFGAFALLLSACKTPRHPTPRYAPSKAPLEALIDRCVNLPETMEVKCPIRVFLKSVYNFADLWEYYQMCGKKLTACEKFGQIDRAEMQGRINEQAARADRNERWIWIVAAIGGGLTIVSFLLGAFAL